ncbi:ABC transporter ATP-binding protein [Candidatus Poribacteria bacterium]|nr:ABC transporter ATP-binding protein [Candidatus Poribacteria bacterium]
MPLEIPQELREEVPESVKRKFEELIDEPEVVQIAVSSDMNLDGEYTESWLLANDQWVVSFNPNHAKEPDIIQLPLSDVVAVKTHNYIGNGMLELHTAEKAFAVLRYSKTMSAKISDAAGFLEMLSSNGTGKKEGKKFGGRRKREGRCEKCGRALPPWSSTCPNCLETKRLMFRLLGYLKPYWYLVIITTIIALATTSLGLLPEYILKLMVDRVFAPVVQTTAEARFQLLNWLIFAVIGAHILNQGVGTAGSYAMQWLGNRVIYDLRSQAYRHLQMLSLSFYSKNETGQLIARISEDTGRLRWFITESLREVVIDTLTIIGMCVILFYQDWQLAALTLIPLPILAFGVGYFGEKMHRLFHRLWRRMSSITAILADTIPGVKVVKAFAAEDREVDRFNVVNKDVFDYSIRVAKLTLAYYPIMGFATFAGGIIVRWFGGRQIIIDQAAGVPDPFTLGTLMLFIGYMMRFYGPIQNLTRMNERFQGAAVAADRLFEIMDADPEIKDTKHSIELPRIEGSIRFENVTFSYDGEKNALENISFEVKRGEMIGLSGPSGAGKSTLITLVCRFYDVTNGTIYIDGHDIRDIKLNLLREQIGVVLQEPFLFHGSIAENIAYGKPHATREEIIAAAKAANAHDFIVNFPDGYDTQVGERGVNMSGGERQRISIARAILKNPRILILDEATSSVDTETESAIQEAIERLVQGRTTFAIAHRLSTLRRANRLIILQDGRLEDMGTHEELLEREGLYKRLVNMQSSLARIVAVAG